jgi:X-Pro dipeptidyl-peptidase C-terminal non-catalytic domain
VTGFPVAHLWLSAPGQTNADVFVYLQMVEADSGDGGRGVYVTEGCFRLEHRCGTACVCVCVSAMLGWSRAFLQAS